MKISKLIIGKAVAASLVSLSVGAVIGNVMKTVAPKSSNPVLNVALSVGGFIITGVVTELTTDKYFIAVDTALAQIEDAKLLAQIKKENGL